MPNYTFWLVTFTDTGRRTVGRTHTAVKGGETVTVLAFMDSDGQFITVTDIRSPFTCERIDLASRAGE